jgi:cytidylate kinase
MVKYIEELVTNQILRSEAARNRLDESGKACVCNIVTISRTMGSGARIIANKLATEIGWSMWDKELINSIAEDARVSKKVAETFDEQKQSEIEMFVRSVLGDHEASGFMYAKHLAKAVASVEKLGNAIILGRGANILLPRALNIRIDASEKLRVSNMIKYEDLTEHEAVAKIRNSDKERHRFMVHTFGRERVENAKFDLQIWMDEFTNDDAVAIIKAALSRKCTCLLK